MSDAYNSMGILDRLEAGEIDAATAADLLEGVRPARPEEPAEDFSNSWRTWWLIPFAVALAVLAGGIALGQVGGWWWLLAAPMLLVAGVVVLLLIASIGSPWVHVRVDTGQENWPRRISISLPLPLRVSAWGLRIFGVYVPGLDNTALDELLLALEGNINASHPIQIEVDEGESGEHIRVYLG
jgi:hypothetical protein